MFSLDYFAPAEDLRPYISSYYLFRSDLPQLADVTRADLGQMRFMLSGRGSFAFTDGVAVPVPPVCVIGPTLAAARFASLDPLVVFGISIRPAGWAMLMRVNAAELSDGLIDARGMFGVLIDDVHDAMANARTVEEMLSIANVGMRALVTGRQDPHLWFTELTDAWLSGALSPSIDSLIREAGLSARQVERLAGRFYGAPPKLVARKYRALRTAVRLATDPGGWRDAAGDAFYDQSHFIREVKRFTGLTPSQLVDLPPPVMRLTFERRRAAAHMPLLAAIS